MRACDGMVQEAACLHFKVAVLTLRTFAQMHLIGIWCWNDEVFCCIKCIFWISNLTRPCSSVVKMRWSFCHRYVVSVFWESISERILKIGLQSCEWLEIAWCVFIGMRCVYCKVNYNAGVWVCVAIRCHRERTPHWSDVEWAMWWQQKHTACMCCCLCSVVKQGSRLRSNFILLLLSFILMFFFHGIHWVI